MPAEESSNSIATALSEDWILTGRPNDSHETQCFILDRFPFAVGRKVGSALMLAGNTVSGAHAEFFREGGSLFLRDLASTNGTFVNGNRLQGTIELNENDLIQFADLPFRLTRSSNARLSPAYERDASKLALAIVQFDLLLTGKSVTPHYQPIVDLLSGDIVAYEVLARSQLIGLETPGFMFSAAAKLGLSTQLSQWLRQIAVEGSRHLGNAPHLFLNTHPSELEKGTLLQACAELRQIAPRHQHLTIEMHEGAMTNVAEMISLRNSLKELNISLAFDDFGAGQARITELAAVHPDYVKFDRCMIHDLHLADAARRDVIAKLVQVIRELGIIPLAECVECEAEARACREVGFALSQGYLYGRPEPAEYYVNQ